LPAPVDDASEGDNFTDSVAVGFTPAETCRDPGMATITKKELIDRITETGVCKRTVVKRIVQDFLDAIIEELGNGNRLEFRDFGVFESRVRAARRAQNPKTLDKVHVPPKRTVKFKVGRVMKMRLREAPLEVDEATGLTLHAAGTKTPRPTQPRNDGAARSRG